MKYYIQTREDRRNDKTGLAPVVILFKSGNKKFTVSTGINVRGKINSVNVPNNEPNSKAKTKKLINISEGIEKYLLDCQDDFNTAKAKLKAIITGENNPTSVKPLADYIKEYAETRTKSGTTELYLLTEKKVRRFDAGATFQNIDKNWLELFQKSLGNVSVNYVSIHLRNIRAVFNWAIDNEITDRYPFRRFKIKTERVKIRNITVEQLITIRDYPLDDWREIYRDFFMLTFYLCGINPIDLLNLKHTDLKNGRISYRRAKTGRMYDIPVPEEAMQIINRYKGKNYLLSPLDKYGSHKDFCHHWNAALKKIGDAELVPDKCGKMRKVIYHPIVPDLTVYVARYTFASIGAELDIPRETIALCLGHAWTDVTSHYISYDLKKIDEAVQKIIEFVKHRP